MNYTPDKLDFQAYVHQRNELLGGPKGRAAIMAGGILARLARDVVAVNDVVYGAGRDVLTNGHCYLENDSLMTPAWDHSLTEDDIDVICGVYYVETGK